MRNRDIKPLNEQSWQKTILASSATIQQAINNLNQSSCQIVLVVSEDNTFLGTLTDGDIRRGLLEGLDLNKSIATLIHKNALLVSPEISREIVLQIMITNKIHQIPVVDERRHIVGLHLWDQITTSPVRSNCMIIMAGGLGKRLRPHTDNCPKPLLPVAGKPMLEHIIERAKSEGFHHFVLAIHYLGQMIEDYFGNGERLKIQIEYLREESLLGTVGALGLLARRPNAPFVVTNGDVLTDIHYGEILDFHIKQHAAGTMAVKLHEWQNPFGVVKTHGIDLVGFEEKPMVRSYINAGVYVLSPESLDELSPNSPCDMPSLFERLKEMGQRVVVYPMHEPWLDVGQPDDLVHAGKKTLKVFA